MSEVGLIAKFKAYFPNFAKEMVAFEVNNNEMTVHLTGDRHFKFKCSENSVSLFAYSPK